MIRRIRTCVSLLLVGIAAFALAACANDEQRTSDVALRGVPQAATQQGAQLPTRPQGQLQPVPSLPGLAVGRPINPDEPFDNANFENPRLDGWTIAGRPLDLSLRKCGLDQVPNVRPPNLPASMPLGGDYWRVPLDGTRNTGAEGNCYLSTQQGAAVASPIFRASRQYLRLLARTKESPIRGTVEIQTAAGATLMRRDIPQGDVMQEVVFDLFTIPDAQRGAIRLAVLTPSQSRFGSDVHAIRL
jgi:hypothetical protein